MFKKIISAFLGSFAAIWVSIFLAGFMFFMLLGMIIGASGGQEISTKNSILYIDLTGEISDRYRPLTVQDILIDNVTEPQSFETIINALHYAADDDNIDGVYINCGGSSLGFALREELAEAIARFKKESNNKKWVYAYSDSYTQGDYYVVSGVDKVFVNPVGGVDVRGIAVQMPFFKNLLDKVGVEMQVVKVGTFKSAVEPFILDAPSEASLLQTHVYIDAIWENIANDIARNRKVSAATVNQWADSIIAVMPADVLVSEEVVSQALYRHQVEDILREKTGRNADEDLRLVTPKDYMQFREGSMALNFNNVLGKDSKHIAVLYAVGDIVDNGETGIVGATMVPEILELAEKDDVAGMVLRVNSGGGSAFASEQIWEALEVFKSKGKPLYVSMGDYAASGGYYISCGAEKIYADANTITGSIGIFGMIPCAKTLVSDHIGVDFYTVQTNPNGDMGSVFEPLTDKQRAALQEHVENGYDLFTSRVAAGRDLPIDSVRAIAEGRVWDGRTALKIGLVDEIGSLSTAVRDLAKKLDMKGAPYISYPQIKLTPMQEIMANAGTMDASMGLVPSDVKVFKAMTPAEARYCITFMSQINNMSSVQARMPMVFLK